MILRASAASEASQGIAYPWYNMLHYRVRMNGP